MVSINPLKRKKTMKKYIFMAVAGMLALSSCSSDDNEQTPQNAPRQMTFTAGFGDGTQTRTTLNTADKSVSFDANDAISIFSENNTNVQFTTTEGGATAEFTGTAVAGDATYYAVYPYNDSYSFNDGIVSGVTIGFSQPMYSSAGEAWSKSSVISYATTIDSELQFHNACALLKIANNTDWATDIHISADQPLAGAFDLDTSTGALTVLYGETLVTTTIPDNATVYLAIAPGNYTNFTAAKSTMMEDDGEWYSKTKASVTFQAGKIYDLGTTSDWMTQTQQAPALNLTSPDVGQVIGSDGKNYDYANPLPDGVTAVAKICYVSGSNGLALALADEFGTMNWNTAMTTAAAHRPAFTGGTWKLATKDEWNNMITVAGSYDALHDGFESVGGSNLDSFYWSSTEKEGNSDRAWRIFNGNWNDEMKVSGEFPVRACLAWGQGSAETGDETGDGTWNSSVMSGNHDLMEGFTRYGVTLSGPGSINNGSLSTEGECTFIAPSGKKFTKIVISAMYSQIEGDGWTNGGEPGNYTSTWNGDASTVSFSGGAGDVTSIVFTTAPAEGHVTWIFSEMASQYNGSVSIVNNQRFEHGGVTLSISEAGSCTLSFMGRSLNTDGTATFTAPDGKKFTSIVITANDVSIYGFDYDRMSATATWSGSSTSVSFSESNYGGPANASGITSIVFTLADE